MPDDAVNPTTGEIVPVEQPAPLTLFGTDDPVKVVAQATAVAQSLAAVLDKQKLYSAIQGKRYVRVEGWTLLGSMLGVFPVCVWTRATEDGWEARVEARTRSGAIVGAAEAECTRGEKTWAERDDYALRSMAQTRATSKALRLPLGFVVALAGFEATPAEEVPSGGFDERPPRQSSGPSEYGNCPAHGVPYFKKGAMRTPAHKQGTGWCNMPAQRKTNAPENDADYDAWAAEEEARKNAGAAPQ